MDHGSLCETSACCVQILPVAEYRWFSGILIWARYELLLYVVNTADAQELLVDNCSN
jgi:hypothetical protein